jgi:flagellar motor switch protein FliN/FliY
MDEEKNGIDLPENSESVEESDAEDAAQEENQGDSPPESTPEEKEMMEMAEDMPDSPAGDDDSGEESDDQPVSEGDDESMPVDVDSEDEAESPAEDKNQILSQDELDAALGEMADQMDSPMPDMGTLSADDEEIKRADFQQLSSSGDDNEPRNIDLLMDVELPVSIELGKTRMRISDILALGPGSIVELDKLVGEPVDLLVNRKTVARGEVVVVEESFGLRITMLVSPEERLKNLQ